MAKYEMFTSIDIGAYHLKGIVMRKKGDTWELLAYSSVRSRGIDGGEIRDAVAFKESLNRLLEELSEQTPKVMHSDFVISFSSFEFGIVNVSNELVLSDTEEKVHITPEHVDKLRELSIEKLSEDDGRMVFHIYPKRFLIDGRRMVFNPIDMNATKLEGEFIVVVLPYSIGEIYRNSLMDVFEFEPTFSASPIASAEGVLSEMEKDSGVVVLNLGHNFSSFIAYQNGVPIKVVSIPLGIKHVIKDVASILGTSMDEAERLLMTHGNAQYLDIEDEEIEYRGLDGRSVRSVSKKKLATIIHARLREILNKARRIYRELEISIPDFRDVGIPGGIVLTGGGAKIPRLIDLAADVFKAPVRTGSYSTSSNPPVIGSEDISADPSFSAAFGSIFCMTRNPYQQPTQKSTSFMKKILDFFRSLW